MSIREQAIKRMMAEESARAVPMSRGDQVVITQVEADAPGVYVSSDQMLQDVYASQVAAGQFTPDYFTATQGIDMNRPASAMPNPNYKVAEPRQITADSAGNIVIY